MASTISRPPSPVGDGASTETDNQNPTVQLTTHTTNEEINGIFFELSKAIDSFTSEKRCRCKNLLSQQLQPILMKLHEASNRQYTELVEMKAVVNHYETRLIQVIDAPRPSQSVTPIKQPTYAEKTQAYPPATDNEAPRVVLIDATNPKETSPQIRNYVRDLSVAQNIPTKPVDVYLTKKNRIVVTLKNRESAEHFADTLDKSIDKERYKVIIPRIKRKKVILLRVPDNVTPENLTQDLQHLLPYTPECLNSTYVTPSISGLRNHVYETDNYTYIQLLKQKKICSNYVSILIEPYIRIIRCNKCQLYGHVARVCKNEAHCASCGGRHGKETCTTKTLRCINCADTSGGGHGHSADSPGCQLFIKKRKEMYDEAKSCLNG